MTFNDFKIIISKDFKFYYRNRNKNLGLLGFIKEYIINLGFKYTFYLRLCVFLKSKKCLLPLYIISRFIYKHLSIKYGIQIPYDTNIKGGFCIYHYNSIVIHGNSIIGENFNIRNSLTIGDNNGKTPTIGDNVYTGANVNIIGNITIGNDVIIGAGTIVTKNVPNGCTVVGCNKIIDRKDIGYCNI